MPNAVSVDFQTNKHDSTECRTKSVASEYLGRSDPNGSQNSGALHGPGTKKASTKGRKRASTTVNQAASKRRKTSNVSDRMPVTKSSSRAKKATTSRLKAPAKHTTADTRTSGGPGKDVADVATNAGAGTLLSVVAPSTSLDILSSTSQQTSLDALRSSSGHGTTLYHGNYPGSGASRTLPMIETSSILQNQNNLAAGSAANTRVLRPRKAVVDQPKAKDLPGIDDCEERTESVSRKESSKKSKHNGPGPKSSTRTTIASRQHTHNQPVSRKSSASNDDDFIGDDGSILEALQLADSIEAEATPRSFKTMTASCKGQPPTPANSDGPTQTRTANSRAPKRKATGLLTPDEDFIDIDDEDEAEMVDLTAAAEETAAPRPRTPPPRERKLNMRDVDKNEDYGGALFSTEERQLLGMLTK